MSATVTTHERLADGSYRLVVTDDANETHEFAFPPFDAAWTMHEGQGAPAMTESDYIDQQRIEAAGLVDAELAAAADLDAPPVNLLS